jgi:hypothetical protein
MKKNQSYYVFVINHGITNYTMSSKLLENVIRLFISVKFKILYTKYLISLICEYTIFLQLAPFELITI